MIVEIHLDQKDPTKQLRDPVIAKHYMAERVVSNIKEYMYSGIFKHPTGALANSIRAFVSGMTIVVYSDKNYAEAQDQGVRAHTMWYLLGKTIPLRSYAFGFTRLSFRKATLQSFLEGKWRHPGYPGKHFVQEGLRRTLSEMPEIEVDYNVKVERNRVL